MASTNTPSLHQPRALEWGGNLKDGAGEGEGLIRKEDWIRSHEVLFFNFAERLIVALGMLIIFQ